MKRSLTTSVAATLLLLSVANGASAHRAGLRIRSATSSRSTVTLDQIQFFLPKQVLHFTVSYDVYQRTNKAATQTVLVVQSPVKLKLEAIPDPNLAFIADYRNLQGLVTDAKTDDLTLTDNGCLKGLNVEYDDQLAPIVAETVAGAIKIGKAIATFAKAVPPNALVFKKLDKPITVEATIDLDDAMTQAEITAASAQLHTGTDLSGVDIKALLPNDYMETAGASMSHIVPRNYKPTIQYSLKSIDSAAKNSAMANGFVDPTIPNLQLYLNQTPLTSKPGDADNLLKGTGLQSDKRGYQVLLARAPEMVEFVVTSDVQIDADSLGYNNNPYCDLDEVSQFAQTGGFNAFEIRRHLLTNAAYKFSCNTAGALTESSSTRTSTLKTLADAFKTITDAL